jgi:hypothetical protein
VRLEFDRGTVTLTGCSEQAAFDLPGVLWDPRVQAYRAPGFRYTAIEAAFANAHPAQGSGRRRGSGSSRLQSSLGITIQSTR